ncbi:cell division control DNA repair exonuclease [Fusarium globosum]|uniref:Cell division control DNA repair exonuclease n=1 Tax=Fusarium globosum TaxID=78864 RepID=A0A8H5YDB4_9HYPO|nr:cell division control DNA repair exonuclease [Fusarium globosum]
MKVVAFLRHGLGLLVPLSIAFTIYLYIFPIVQGCAFPVESRNSQEAYDLTKKFHWPSKPTADDHAKLAPFRLLALGDPQLEGDTSIITNYLGTFPHVQSVVKHVTFQTTHWCFRERVRKIIHDIVDIIMEDLPYYLMSQRKRFDLWGNDFYLAHIYRQVNWWSNPTHVSVLGDLVGSQWIDDKEFEKRGRRFWNRVFKGTERLSDELAQTPSNDYNISGVLDGSDEAKLWKKRMLNVAGNHDIGYAGDLTEERLERFERVFGKANYELRFELPITDPKAIATMYSDSNPKSKRVIPELRIVAVNDMNLDTPAKSIPLQDATYGFINNAISTAGSVEYEGQFTLILTHIPMYKPAGICVDAPFFDFHTAADGGGLKEQNQLSSDASRGFLEGIWGMSSKRTAPGGGYGRAGLMLNGHDHAGCDTYHYINQTNGTDPSQRQWEVKTWSDAQDLKIPGTDGMPGRREITVRSMMGDFGGNAGLLSLWFDQESWEWKYEYATCPLGSQHFWWFVHIFDFIVLVWMQSYAVLSVMEAYGVDVDGPFWRGVSRMKDFVLRRKQSVSDKK